MMPGDGKLEAQDLPKYQKDKQMYPKVKKCRRRCHSVVPGHPRCQKNTTRQPKVALRPKVRSPSAKKHVQTARGRVLAEGDVDPPHLVKGSTACWISVLCF